MSMQDLVANVDNIIFDVEVALEEQRGAQQLPFAGMDSMFQIYYICIHIYIISNFDINICLVLLTLFLFKLSVLLLC